MKNQNTVELTIYYGEKPKIVAFFSKPHSFNLSLISIEPTVLNGGEVLNGWFTATIGPRFDDEPITVQEVFEFGRQFEKIDVPPAELQADIDYQP
jgi:hypothetical protein